MSSPILDFAKRLEDECGVPMWRHCWVIPADRSETGKKDYHFERPGASEDEIVNGYKTANGGQVPARGYAENPRWAWNKTPALQKAERNVSIYLKYVKDLYCVDFDTRDKCILEEGKVPDPQQSGCFLPINPLFKMMMESGTPYTETAKGFHFYTYVVGCPDFQNGLKIAKDEAVCGEVDLIGRKQVGQSNIIENEKHQIHNPDAKIVRIPWDEFSEYVNVPRMNGTDKKHNDKISQKEKSETKSIHQAIVGLPKEKFVGYLNRLRKKDDETRDHLRSRFNYDDFLKIGLIAYNNFADRDEGFSVWLDWVKSDPTMSDPSHDHSKRSVKYLMDKWDGFTDRTDGDKVSWRTLRAMANKDTPSSNVYQEIYDSGGIDGVVEYMNEFIAYSRQCNDIIFQDPENDMGHHTFSRFKEVDKVANLFQCYQVFVSADDFATIHAPGIKKGWNNPFTWWRNSLLRRNVSGIVFDPSPHPPKNVFNIFSGFEIDRQDVSDWTLEDAMKEVKPLTDHIFNIWCKKNQVIYDYIMNWFAHILQFPYIKIGVMLCVKSKEGGGKGIVFDFMRHILGTKLYCQINSLDQILGRFNRILEGKLLINGDEVVFGGDVKAANRLKGLITESEVQIEDKNVSMYPIQSSFALAIASNERNPMSAREGDRRHIGVECDNKWCGRQKSLEHKKYFQDISGCISSGIARNKAEAFAKILFSRDISNWNKADIPMTEFTTEQIERNWTPLEKFWYGILQTGYISIDEKFMKPTRESYTEEGYEKTRLVDFDKSQLDYGNVGPQWGNGEKLVEDKYILCEPPTPVYACAFIQERWDRKYGENCSYICLRSAWQEVLTGIKEREEYDFGTIDIVDIPVPKSFVEQFYQEYYEGDHSDWDEDGCDYVEECFRGLNGYKKYYDNGSSTWMCEEDQRLGKRQFGNRASPWGFQRDHIQPGGKCPKITEKYNRAKDGSEDGLFRCGIGWHCADMLDSKAYTLVDTLLREEDEYESCQRSYIRDFDCGLQVPDDCYSDWRDAIMKERPKNLKGPIKRHSEWSCCSYTYFRKGGFSIVGTDEFDEYIKKFGYIHKDNFHLNLLRRPLFDEKGKQMMKTEYVPKVVRHHYDKDWFYAKYQQSMGLGYGHNSGSSVSKEDFYKTIKEFLGGSGGKGKTGKYVNVRSQDKSVRKTFWKFVPIEEARECFQQWTGRMMSWDDDDVEEDYGEADFSDI